MLIKKASRINDWRMKRPKMKKNNMKMMENKKKKKKGEKMTHEHVLNIVE